jgi:hypothetical protein
MIAHTILAIVLQYRSTNAMNKKWKCDYLDQMTKCFDHEEYDLKFVKISENERAIR